MYAGCLRSNGGQQPAEYREGILLGSVAKEYEGCNQFNNKTKKPEIPYREAVVTKEYFDWKNYQPVKARGGRRESVEQVDLGTIARYIDWGPFFIAWEMPGHFRMYSNDKIFGTEAKRIYADARNCCSRSLTKMADGRWGDWLLARQDKQCGYHHLQTKMAGETGNAAAAIEKAVDNPPLLADFICPAELGSDYMGSFAVTIHGAGNILIALPPSTGTTQIMGTDPG